jgi:hypothetical protein
MKIQIIITLLSLFVISQEVVLSQSLQFSISNITCNGQCNGSMSINQIFPINCGNGPYQYEIVAPILGTITSPVTSATSYTFPNLCAGNYTLNILVNGTICESAGFNISQPNPISIAGAVNNVQCCGAANGAVVIAVSGGTAPYYFQWNGSNNFSSTSQNIAQLPTGQYSVQVTDANGCSDTVTYTITEPDCFTPSLDSVVNTPCQGGSVFYTFNGGTGPYYSELYLNGLVCNSLGSEEEEQLSVNGLISGLYVLNLTDATGCSNFQQFNINSPTPISAQTNLSSPNCSGDMNGMINLTLTGGSGTLTYVWINGETTEDIINIGAGIYSVTITDSLGCIILYSYTLTEPSQIVINCSINGNAIDITVSGGTPGYTFSWSNGATTEDLSNLSSGTYSVIVTDANGCTSTQSFTVDNVGLEQQQSVELQVFPNPTNDELTIRGSVNSLGHHSYVIQDSYGRKVLEGSFEDNEENLSVAHLAPGLYQLHVGVKTISFVVIH